jgi:hypothetical protein
MRGFKNFDAAHRFCRAFDEVCNFLRPASTINQNVSLARRRIIHVPDLRRVIQLLVVSCLSAAQLAPKADRTPGPARLHQDASHVIFECDR